MMSYPQCINKLVVIFSGRSEPRERQLRVGCNYQHRHDERSEEQGLDAKDNHQRRFEGSHLLLVSPLQSIPSCRPFEPSRTRTVIRTMPSKRYGNRYGPVTTKSMTIKSEIGNIQPNFEYSALTCVFVVLKQQICLHFGISKRKSWRQAKVGGRNQQTRIDKTPGPRK